MNAVAAVGIAKVFRRMRSGQYDDLEGASQRIFEEDLPPRK